MKVVEGEVRVGVDGCRRMGKVELVEIEGWVLWVCWVEVWMWMWWIVMVRGGVVGGGDVIDVVG